MVVRRVDPCSHLAWDGDGFMSVSTYELVSCDIAPGLKKLCFGIGPFPEGCVTPGFSDLLERSKAPRFFEKQIDDPSVLIDDIVLEEMRGRGVEVVYDT